MSRWLDRHITVILAVIFTLAFACFAAAIAGPILWPHLGETSTVIIVTPR